MSQSQPLAISNAIRSAVTGKAGADALLDAIPKAETFLASGTITIKHGIVTVGGVGSTLTLPDQDTATALDDGNRISVYAANAVAHVVNYNSANTATFGGAAGDSVTFEWGINNQATPLVRRWYATNVINCTLG